MQNQVDYQGGQARNNVDNLRTNITRQNQGLENRFNVGSDRAEQDYGNLSGLYDQQYNSIVNAPNRNFGAYSGYQNFADTGGYSPQNIQDIRARSIAPIRSIYASAMDNVNRNKALAGGYSPNAPAALAKMAREQSYALSDQTTNAEAGLADAIRQGKLAGLSGMTGIDTSLLGADLQKLGLGNQALQGATSLYGTQPGMAGLFGKLMMDSSGQTLDVEGLNNDIMKAILGGQNNVSNTAGNTASVLGNVGSAVGMVGDVAKMINPLSYGGR